MTLWYRQTFEEAGQRQHPKSVQRDNCVPFSPRAGEATLFVEERVYWLKGNLRCMAKCVSLLQTLRHPLAAQLQQPKTASRIYARKAKTVVTTDAMTPLRTSST
jgi:hypothetical protein